MTYFNDVIRSGIFSDTNSFTYIEILVIGMLSVGAFSMAMRLMRNIKV
jgi:hypothetical protein